MIRLTDLAGNGSFNMGGKKFEYGKVYSNPYATAFKSVNEGEESTDHEVSMAQSSLDSIIKAATELKQKMGKEEKQIPAWIQDHITNSENYITQAASNYHEYGDSNEEVNEAPAQTKGEKIQRYNDRVKKLRDKITATKNSEQKMKYQTTLKGILQRLSDIRKDHGIKAPHKESISEIKFDEIRVLSKEEFQNEAGPCWNGYKQVGMKNKNGKQVPNCVPESIVKEGGRGVGMIQKDYAKVIDAIQSELEKYKINKGTDKAKQNVENLKKLNIQKQKLEAELDSKVSSLYKDYDLDQLNFLKTLRK